MPCGLTGCPIPSGRVSSRPRRRAAGLEVIRDIRERQWLNGLPIALRNQLTGVDDARRAEKIQQWKDEEARQRNLWVFVRKNAEAIIGDKVPWPFETEASKKEVIEYVRVAHHLDDPKRCPAESIRARRLSRRAGFGREVRELGVVWEGGLRNGPQVRNASRAGR